MIRDCSAGKTHALTRRSARHLLSYNFGARLGTNRRCVTTERLDEQSDWRQAGASTLVPNDMAEAAHRLHQGNWP
jgi:hypothetical protein